jgi:hypothetical protein
MGEGYPHLPPNKEKNKRAHLASSRETKRHTARETRAHKEQTCETMTKRRETEDQEKERKHSITA